MKSEPCRVLDAGDLGSHPEDVTTGIAVGIKFTPAGIVKVPVVWVNPYLRYRASVLDVADPAMRIPLS
jgi:hypothetical protein